MTLPLLTSCSALNRFLKNYDVEAGATYTTPSGSSLNTYVKLNRSRSGKSVAPVMGVRPRPSGKDVISTLPNLPGVNLHTPKRHD